MANFTEFFSKALKHEGGFVDHPLDPGGATNKGILLRNWKRYGYDKDMDGDIDIEDLKLITDQDVYQYYKQHYWDKIWGDSIRSQKLADIIFDHGLNAGPSRAIKMVQELLNRYFGFDLLVDGIMGKHTLHAINTTNSAKLHNLFKLLRGKYYRHRADDIKEEDRDTLFFKNQLQVFPQKSQQVFLTGWLNRVNSFSSVSVLSLSSILLFSTIFLLTQQLLKK